MVHAYNTPWPFDPRKKDWGKQAGYKKKPPLINRLQQIKGQSKLKFTHRVPRFRVGNEHKYLGPGNNITPQEPADRDDEIALIHDQDYSTAKTNQDIHRADQKAIGDFVEDLITNKNWHSALGAAGLGIKHLAEKAINTVVYPNLGNYGKTEIQNIFKANQSRRYST